VTDRNLRREGMETEIRASHYLELQGYEIIERNFALGRRGEIDIIARDGDDLVFCEVKSRNNDEFGPPEYALTALKQHTIRKVANAYLGFNRIRDQACRFDVVLIRWYGNRGSVTLMKNAF
jgi:putative endonuclease